VRHPQRLAAHPLGRFGRPRRRLRAGLVQLLFAVAGLGLGLLLPRITAAPPQRRSSITWRLHRAEELAAGNFPAIWRHAAGYDPA
jgi:hypothetical protein